MGALECFLIFGDLLLPLIELVMELFIDVGSTKVRERRSRENHGPVAATLGYLVLGGVVGGVSVWVLPQRMLPPSAVPGLSLVLGPLVAGTGMYFWGVFRRERGHTPTNLATFYGGAAFALGVAVVRFLYAE